MSKVKDNKASAVAIIESINDKVDRLVARNAELKDECGKLREQNLRCKGDNMALKTRIAGLEKRIAVLELRDGIIAGRGDDKKRAQARVNTLMREVDKCIALLSR